MLETFKQDYLETTECHYLETIWEVIWFYQEEIGCFDDESNVVPFFKGYDIVEYDIDKRSSLKTIYELTDCSVGGWTLVVINQEDIYHN